MTTADLNAIRCVIREEIAAIMGAARAASASVGSLSDIELQARATYDRTQAETKPCLTCGRPINGPRRSYCGNCLKKIKKEGM